MKIQFLRKFNLLGKSELINNKHRLHAGFVGAMLSRWASRHAPEIAPCICDLLAKELSYASQKRFVKGNDNVDLTIKSLAALLQVLEQLLLALSALLGLLSISA